MQGQGANPKTISTQMAHVDRLIRPWCRTAGDLDIPRILPAAVANPRDFDAGVHIFEVSLYAAPRKDAVVIHDLAGQAFAHWLESGRTISAREAVARAGMQ